MDSVPIISDFTQENGSIDMQHLSNNNLKYWQRAARMTLCAGKRFSSTTKVTSLYSSPGTKAPSCSDRRWRWSISDAELIGRRG